jgi:hypothetical protein
MCNNTLSDGYFCVQCSKNLPLRAETVKNMGVAKFIQAKLLIFMEVVRACLDSSLIGDRIRKEDDFLLEGRDRLTDAVVFKLLKYIYFKFFGAIFVLCGCN